MNSIDRNIAHDGVISSPHLHSSPDIMSLMTQVLLALVPGIVVYIAIFGFGVVVQIMIAILAAWSFDCLLYTSDAADE